MGEGSYRMHKDICIRYLPSPIMYDYRHLRKSRLLGGTPYPTSYALVQCHPLFSADHRSGTSQLVHRNVRLATDRPNTNKGKQSKGHFQTNIYISKKAIYIMLYHIGRH